MPQFFVEYHPYPYAQPVWYIQRSLADAVQLILVDRF
jgi:hypothetical protein